MEPDKMDPEKFDEFMKMAFARPKNPRIILTEPGEYYLHVIRKGDDEEWRMMECDCHNEKGELLDDVG